MPRCRKHRRQGQWRIQRGEGRSPPPDMMSVIYLDVRNDGSNDAHGSGRRAGRVMSGEDLCKLRSGRAKISSKGPQLFVSTQENNWVITKQNIPLLNLKKNAFVFKCCVYSVHLSWMSCIQDFTVLNVSSTTWRMLTLQTLWRRDRISQTGGGEAARTFLIPFPYVWQSLILLCNFLNNF